MKALLVSIFALTATTSFAETVSCEEYFKTVKIDQAWVKCNLEYDRDTFVDLVISPEIDGKRVSITWSGARFGELDETVSPVSEVIASDITETQVSARVRVQPAGRDEMVRGKIRAVLIPGGTLFSGSEFQGRARFGSRIFGRQAICSLVPPAFFERNVSFCTNGLGAKRDCLDAEIWRHLNPGKPPQSRVRFVQDPITHQYNCSVRLEYL